jgi:hypothetical protein
MPTVTKWKPGTGTTNGRGVKLTGTNAGASQTLHTAQASAVGGCADLVEVTVFNSDTVDRKITFLVGGITEPDDNRGGTVPAGEERTFGPFFLQNGLLLKAYGAAANVLAAHPRYREVVFS